MPDRPRSTGSDSTARPIPRSSPRCSRPRARTSRASRSGSRASAERYVALLARELERAHRPNHPDARRRAAARAARGASRASCSAFSPETSPRAPRSSCAPAASTRPLPRRRLRLRRGPPARPSGDRRPPGRAALRPRAERAGSGDHRRHAGRHPCGTGIAARAIAVATGAYTVPSSPPADRTRCSRISPIPSGCWRRFSVTAPHRELELKAVVPDPEQLRRRLRGRARSLRFRGRMIDRRYDRERRARRARRGAPRPHLPSLRTGGVGLRCSPGRVRPAARPTGTSCARRSSCRSATDPRAAAPGTGLPGGPRHRPRGRDLRPGRRHVLDWSAIPAWTCWSRSRASRPRSSVPSPRSGIPRARVHRRVADGVRAPLRGAHRRHGRARRRVGRHAAPVTTGRGVSQEAWEVPELGPSLGRLTDPAQPAAGPLGVRLDDIRLQLVTGVFELAGAGRSFAAAGDPVGAAASLSRVAWLALWEKAVAAAAERITGTVNARLEDGGEESRYPAAKAARARSSRRTDTRAIAARGSAVAEPPSSPRSTSWSRQPDGSRPREDGIARRPRPGAPPSPRPRAGWRRPGSRWRRRRTGAAPLAGGRRAGATPGGGRAGRSG